MSVNFAEYLLYENQAGLSPDHPITYFNGKAYTLSDFRESVQALVNIFEEKGFQPKSSAVLLIDDSPLAASIYIACMYYGIVPAAMDKRAATETVDNAIEAADISYIFTDGELDLSRFNSKVRLIKAVYDLNGDYSKKVLPDTYDITVLNPDADIAPKYVNSDETAYFLMTSGSTGKPKVVMHSHISMPATIKNYAIDTLDIGRGDIIFSAAKMSFGFGVTNNVFYPFGTGAPSVLFSERFHLEVFLNIVRDIKPTIVFALPSMYQVVADYFIKNPDQLPMLDCVRAYVSSGEYLPPPLAAKWHDLTGKHLINNVGSSEASAYLIKTPTNSKFGSAGKPVPGAEIVLLNSDEADNAIMPEKGGTVTDPSSYIGKTGTLRLRSMSNSIGYHNNPEENQLKYDGDWFITGDVFRVDEDGDFWYMGREDNLLKYHGLWIAPNEIENKLAQFPSIDQAVVLKVAVGDNEMLGAVIKVNELYTDTVSIQMFVRETMEHYKTPLIFKIVEEFPQNDRGKIDLAALRKLFTEG
ncbi:MAG: acyl--CoA ligase [Firmicutes bacterium]|nr:acyl--CoA ligase [Bacillota bacterium]